MNARRVTAMVLALIAALALLAGACSEDKSSSSSATATATSTSVPAGTSVYQVTTMNTDSVDAQFYSNGVLVKRIQRHGDASQDGGSYNYKLDGSWQSQAADRVRLSRGTHFIEWFHVDANGNQLDTFLTINVSVQ